MKVAVDAMGGDNVPQVIIEGIEEARNPYPDLEFDLYGNPDKVKPLIKNNERLNIVATSEEISMGEEPVRTIRRKKGSSIVRAATAVKEEKADTFFSAGDIGAILAADLFIIGCIKGIDCPGLASILPIAKPGVSRHGFAYLDIGANTESKEKNLKQYTHLGKSYAENVLGVVNPRTTLLDSRVEEDRGDKLHKGVWQIFDSRDDLNLVGNIESGDLLLGKTDVVVSDGWMIDATLKATEGTAKMMMTLIKDRILHGGLRAKLGYLMLEPVFRQIGQKISVSTCGGAVLLGLKTPVVKTHGSANTLAVENTISQIRTMIKTGVIEKTAEFFDNTENLDNSKKNE